MAVAYIAEFTDVASFGNGACIAVMPPIAEQTVAIGAEADSAAFNSRTRFIRVQCDAICSIAIGTSPTASTSTLRLPAESVEYFAIPKGENYKISVISNT